MTSNFDTDRLLPFGRRVTDGALVDVEEVERGERCGCVCPACGLPLVARHGEVNAWHFAHVVRNAVVEVREPCEFSFYVSVRLMAEQIAMACRRLALPEYGAEFRLGHDIYGNPQAHSFVVTEGRTVNFSEVETDTRYQGAHVDIVGRISGFYLIAVISHPGRPVSPAVRELAGPKLGVIDIDITDLYRRFQGHKQSLGTFKQTVERFLSDETEGKHWLFHPAYQSKLKSAKDEAARTMAKRNQMIAEMRRKRR